MELYVTMEGRWGRRGITNERGEKMRRDDKRSALQSRRDFCNVVCTVSVRGSPTANVVISRRERERERERERPRPIECRTWWWWHDEKESCLGYDDTVDNTIRVFVSQDAE